MDNGMRMGLGDHIQSTHHYGSACCIMQCMLRLAPASGQSFKACCYKHAAKGYTDPGSRLAQHVLNGTLQYTMLLSRCTLRMSILRLVWAKRA